MKNKVPPYSKLAFFYDEMMGSISYQLWAIVINTVARMHFKKNFSVLELSSGTGKLSNYLNRFFKNYILTDISLAMLKNCSKRNRRKVCCDMVSLPFNKKFDFIFSAFDSVNYLTSKKKWLKFLNEVEQTLSADGVFTFDVTLEKNSFNTVKVYNREGKFGKINYKQTSTFDTKTRIHKNIFDFTIDNENFKEIHRQKVYPFDFYYDIINKTNFYVSHCFECFTFKKANPNCERVQFILRKKVNNVKAD